MPVIDLIFRFGPVLVALILTALTAFLWRRALAIWWAEGALNPFAKAKPPEPEVLPPPTNALLAPQNIPQGVNLLQLLGIETFAPILNPPTAKPVVLPPPPHLRLLLRQPSEISLTRRVRPALLPHTHALLAQFPPSTDFLSPPLPEETTSLSPYLLKCMEGLLAGKEWAIEQPRFVVSGQPIAGTIVVDNNTVSAPHALLELEPDGTIYVSDLGSFNGTHIDGEEIRGRRVPVRINNTHLQVGEVLFVIDVTRRTLTERSRNRHRGVQVLQKPGRYLISRDVLPVVALNHENDPLDSRIKTPHAVVSLDRRCEIRDLTWEGGIRINDVAAGKRRIFEYNEHRIQLGDSVFRLFITGMSEEAQWTIDRYLVQHPIKQGGMAQVYKVETLEGEVFALKMPHPEKLQELEFKRFWRREQHFMSKLNHPRLVKAYNFGQYKNNIPYMVMDYIDGCSLYDVLKTVRQPFSWQQAAAIIADVAEGLIYVHGRGVAHCDIKPANVLVNRMGDVFLSDFGIAVELGDPASDMGTFPYIAPELLRSDRRTPVTEACDIYSLGAVFYELLTGQRLPTQPDQLLMFTAENSDDYLNTALAQFEAEKDNMPFLTRTESGDTQRKFRGSMQKSFTKVVNPLEANMGENVPPIIKELVIKCIELQPENRYKHCRTLYQDLIQHLDNQFDRSELQKRVAEVVAPKN